MGCLCLWLWLAGADDVHLVRPLTAADQPEVLWSQPAAASAALAFSPDGRWVAVVHGGVELRRATDGALIGTISGAFGGIMSLAFSPDSLQLASGDGDGAVRVHNVWDGSLSWAVKAAGDVTGVTYGARGMLASWSSDQNRVDLWQADTGTLRGHLAPYEWSHYSVAFSPDGTLVALGGDFDPVVRVLSVADGLALHTLAGHTDRVRTVAFSPDGATLATAGDDGEIRLWNVAEGALLRVLSGHAEAVWKVALAPNSTLASSGTDGTIQLWRTSDGALLRTYQAVGLGGSYSLEFSPEGSLFAFEEGGQVVVARNPAPAIATQPARLTRYRGETASFTVLATGEGPLYYQWKLAGTPLAGETNATLTLPSVEPAQGGVYTVEVSNRLGRVLSRPVDLSVLARPMGPGSLDVRFDPTGRGDRIGFAGGIPGIQAMVTDPQGRFLVGGVFAGVNGTVRRNLARLHPDGTVDRSFDPGLGVDGSVTVLAWQPDGAILAGGQFAVADGQRHGRLVRLDQNGRVDPTFNVTLGNSTWPTLATPTSMAVQSDGHIWVCGSFTEVNGALCTNVARLNPDGALASPTGLDDLAARGNLWVDRVAVQSDDRVLLGGCWTNPLCSLVQLRADGTLDPSFAGSSALGIDARSPAHLADLAAHRDGRIAIVGDFWTVNGVTRHGVAWLLSDGTLDASFDPGTGPQDSIARRLAIEPDGRLIVGGWFSQVQGALRRGLARFNTDGTLDLTFDPGMAIGHPGRPNVNALARLSDGRCLVGADDWDAGGTNCVLRIEPTGGRDAHLQVQLQTEPYAVRTAAVQADGCVLVAGWFTGVNGFNRDGVARLRPDGLLDTTFAPAADPNLHVWAMAIQPDEKVLLGGRNWGPDGSPALVRLQKDGRIDPAFSGPTTEGESPLIETIALQPDGRILIGGLFSAVAGVERRGVARLNANGSVDGTFQGPKLTLSDDEGYGVEFIHVYSDGRILIAGGFGLGEMTPFSIARLQPDGTIDTSFVADLPERAPVRAMAVQADGRILLAGPFPNETDFGRLLRLLPDGGSDPTFQAAIGRGITALAVQPDGRILAATNSLFTGAVVRLRADGTQDLLWQTVLAGGDAGVNPKVLLPLGDGQVILTGEWQAINGVPQPGVARLNGDASACSLQARGRLSAAGAFLFQFTGIAGGRYVIETSPDLREWSTWLMLEEPTSPLELTDSTAGESDHRFFRAHLVP